MSSLRSFSRGRISKNSANHWDSTENRDAGLVCPLVVRNQSTEDNRRTVRRRYSRFDISCRDIRNQISIDIRGIRYAVEFLQDIERDFLLGVNQRHDFELKRHFLKLNARLRAEIVDDARRATCGWLERRQRVDRHRNFRAGSDNGFLVVARKDHRARDDFEFPRRIERMHNRGETETRLREKRLAPPLVAAPATRLAKLVRVVGSRGVIPMLFFVSAAPPVLFGRVVWLPSGLVMTCVPVLLKVWKPINAEIFFVVQS